MAVKRSGARSRRPSRAAFVAVPLLLSACVSGAQAVAPAASAPVASPISPSASAPRAPASSAVPAVQIDVGPGVSPEDEADVRTGVTLAQALVEGPLRSRGVPVRIRIFAGGTTGADPRLQGNCCGAVSADAISLDADHAAWRAGPLPARLWRQRIVIHEYVHIWQRALGCHDGPPLPEWFIEGFVEYAAYEAINRAAPETRSITLAAMRVELRNAPPQLRSLRAFEPRAFAVATGYGRSYFAWERLVGNGLDRATAFCLAAARGSGRDWHDAFASIFGRTVDTFYDELEVYVSELLRG